MGILANVRARLVIWLGLGLIAIGSGQATLARQPQPAAQPQGAAASRRAAAQPVAPLRVINESDDPVLKRFVWRSIGPAVMGGRIDDIAADESNPSVMYVAYATGGLWKTVNNGTTWTSLFDEQPVSSIGALALSQSNPNILYVGTGEPNNRQSSSFGAGVYKSTDAGKTFEYVGLKETQSIGRMVVHPKDPNIVYVAAVGHLFGPNPERGLYKTSDGGKTWTNTKFIDNDTGFIDVVMHPTNPSTLFAASYQRRRQPWGFNGGGEGSGIWRTDDAGKTWTRLTGSGLPTNPMLGRIGLSISRSKPNVVYAQLEVGPSGGTGAGVNDDGSLVQPGQGRGGGGGGGGRGGAPEEPKPDPARSGVWRSDDGGKTWQFRSNNNNRPMYYSKIRVDPTQPRDRLHDRRQRLQVGRRRPHLRRDGRPEPQRSPRAVDQSAQQPASRHRQRWRPRHQLRPGQTWEEISLSALGQFYAISVDMRKPYYVCGGLQDNGSLVRPERGPQRHRQRQQRLVSHRRRRRLLHRERPARLEDRLRRDAGRQHVPATTCAPARRDRSGRFRRSIRGDPGATPPSARDGRAGWRSARSARSAGGRGDRRSAGGQRSAAAAAQGGGRGGGGGEQRRPAASRWNGLSLLLEHAVRARRPRSERACTSAAIASSSRRTAATRGW